ARPAGRSVPICRVHPFRRQAPGACLVTSTPSTTTSSRAGKPAGTVAFVGTGPGDPGLLTVRAVEVLEQADVVVLDQLLTAGDLARWTRADVEVVETGFGED